MKDFTIQEILAKTENLVLLNNQKEFREQMATFIRMHKTRVKAIEKGMSPSSLPYISMLVIAKTGCGKTYVASRVAEAAGVNLITVDCSALTQSGYKGVNLGNIMYDTMNRVVSKEKFETSIVLFDEFDKMRICDDYHNAGNPQCNFLKLFDGILQADVGNSSTATINTTRMSFIFSGAFSGGLAEIIEKRRDTSVSIGFGAERAETSKTVDMLKYATMHDIEQYGIMAELCGRINYLFYLPPLTIDDYKALIKGSGGSMLERYRNLFSIHGVDANISDAACEHIATLVSQNGLGARSVNPLLYEKFQQSFPVIDREPKINKVVLDYTKENGLDLIYAAGKRELTDKPVRFVTERRVTFPDLNYSFELRSTALTHRLINHMLDAYTLNGEDDAYNMAALRAFLECTLWYFRDNINPEEMTFASIEKMASITKRDGPHERSTFDQLILNGIRGYRLRATKEDESCELKRKYRKFRKFYGINMQVFLTEAIREIRCNWYTSLLESLE